MKPFNLNHKKILITGSTGFLGSNLSKYFKKKYNIFGIARKNADINCDIADSKLIKKTISEIDPDIIIHTAGLKDVDYCEKNKLQAQKVNIQGTKNIINSLKTNVKVIFISSIAVYPNTSGLHKEELTGPVNYYGYTKLEAEKIVRKMKNFVNLRTVFFGLSNNQNHQTFCNKILDYLSNRKQLRLYNDEFFSPVHIKTLILIIDSVIEKNIIGTYNIASRNGMSKKDFAIEFARSCGYYDFNYLTMSSAKDYSRVNRAMDSRLSPKKIEKKLNFRFLTLREEINKKDE